MRGSYHHSFLMTIEPVTLSVYVVFSFQNKLTISFLNVQFQHVCKPQPAGHAEYHSLFQTQRDRQHCRRHALVTTMDIAPGYQPVLRAGGGNYTMAKRERGRQVLFGHQYGAN